MPIDLTNPIFNDETKAREYLESVRWPDGPFCPHCGETEKVRKLEGKSHRPGLYQCNSCRGHFTVTVGTLYERSKVPLHKWLLASHLLSASKKGMSAHQLHRMLNVTYKTAWFMAHRIREAMKPTKSTPEGGPMGGSGKVIEVDETYFGNVKKSKPHSVFVTGKGWVQRGGRQGQKMKVVSLVERGGNVRSFHVENVTSAQVQRILFTNVRRDSSLMSDEAAYYNRAGREFASHESVNHSADEYVRGNAHTNTIEGFFSIFKRGMKGIYQHCGEQHLKRYLAEFDFRYNFRKVSDAERAIHALKGIEGRRLTYRRIDERRVG